MPKQLEEKLRRQADKHPAWSKERKDAYVFGTMRNTGWVPSTQHPRARALKKRLNA